MGARGLAAAAFLDAFDALDRIGVALELAEAMNAHGIEVEPLPGLGGALFAFAMAQEEMAEHLAPDPSPVLVGRREVYRNAFGAPAVREVSP